jgi:hypothetical protein
MAVGIKSWSTTALDNGTADANVNFAEQQAPSTYNDSARALMAAVKAFTLALGGGITYGGTGNAYTATNETPGVWSAYEAGDVIGLKANATNTGAATINVDGLGAKAIKTADGGDVVSGDIVSGGLYLLAYDGTNFQVLNTIAGGAYQPLTANGTAFGNLTFSSTNGFLRATDAGAFVAEAAAAHKTALSLAKADVGLGNVDNTSDAVKNAAAVTLTNKTLTTPTINGAALSGTISGAPTWSSAQTFPAGTSVGGSLAYGGILNVKSGASSQASITIQNPGVGTAQIGIAAASDALKLYNCYTDGLLANGVGIDIFKSGDVTIPAAPTALSTNSVGFRGLGAVINNSHNAAYTFALSDAGLGVRHTSGSHTWTIPPESSVAWPDGAVISILVFDGTTVTVAEGSGVTLNRADGVSGTGSRTVTGPALACISKWTTNSWYITGAFT